jgi:hypothetical protein
MRCGIQFPIEKEGKNDEISFCFISLPSFQQLPVVRKEGVGRGARNEGRRENSSVNFSCYT